MSDPIDQVLEDLDLVLTGTSDLITLSRDQAHLIAEHLRVPAGELSDEQLLKVWTLGFQSGMTSTFMNMPSLVRERGRKLATIETQHEVLDETIRAIWDDPAMRQTIIESIFESIEGHLSECDCGAPWHPQKGDRS